MAVLANESDSRADDSGLSGWLEFGDLWCAEHGGEIAGFAKLDIRLSRLEDWNEHFKREVMDLRKWTKWGVVVLTVGSAAVPVGFLVAPALAARLGALGLLGVASTGTPIGALSGAALKSASLAYLGGGALASGGGGMAFGTGLIGLAAGCLATRASAAVAYAYAKDVEDYEVKALRPRRAGAVLFINGFCQQDDGEFDDWLIGTRTRFGRRTCYGVRWESGRLAELSEVLSDGAKWATARVSLQSLLSRLGAGLAAAKGLFVVEGLAELVKGILANPWHVAFHKAAEVGVLNADMLSRYDGPAPTLMGHSLGARTIYFTLLQLAGREGGPVVRDVFLFGGAVGGAERQQWAKAATAVSGTIYNFHSTNDDVLSKLYRVANPGWNKPIGLRRIRSRATNIVNVPCTDLVDGHMDYKRKLDVLLERAHRQAPW